MALMHKALGLHRAMQCIVGVLRLNVVRRMHKYRLNPV